MTRGARIFLLALSAVVIVGVLVFVGYWVYANILRDCLFIDTPGQNLITGRCKTFPNSCLPLGYREDFSCPGGPQPINRLVPK